MSLTFSVVVTAYDNAQYLPGCLDSMLLQTHEAWECVVVDDASPDASAEVARAYAERDSRFRLLSLAENGGLHRARRAGVAEATGDYVIFVDPDDELAPTALADLARAIGDERPDMVHFGIDVIGCGVGEKDCAAFEDNVNAPLGRLEGGAICEAIFDEAGGYAQDWRVTQRAYRTPFAQEAFAAMTPGRLERAEDCYELLVLADRARDQLTVNDVRALRYFFGRGVTGTSAISAEVFARFCKQFRACIDAMGEYAEGRGEALSTHVAGARAKLHDLLMNDWHRRVSDAEKDAAARVAAQELGAVVVAAQLMRLARDAAYATLSARDPFDGTQPFVRWFDLADELAGDAPEGEGASRLAEYRRAACSHIAELEQLADPVERAAEEVAPVRSRDYDRQNVRIFVTTHKDVALFESDVLQPVQVGFARPRRRFLWALQDDAGENISDLNAMYCELTTQYWAWKNVEADYYGFCHYRRYFDFSEERHLENAYGEVMANYIDWGAQERFCLDDESIKNVVGRYDVITTGVNDVRRFPERYRDLTDHYARAPHLSVDDLTKMTEILAELHPECVDDAVEFLHGHTACFCNMFIMRKDLFRRYCAWMFPVLERFMETWDTSHLSHEALRTPGHLSERLLNIFLLHERRMNPELRWGELQCVHFEHPERASRPRLAPVSDSDRPVVPIVLAADDAYVPMLTTTLLSALRNASRDRFYDVVIFEKDISPRNQQLMRAFFSERFDNAALRFVDVSGLTRSYDLKTSNEHISVETYYRFLIQDVMPGYDKVLYLDSDLIVRGDVAELFDTELDDSLLAAALDIDYLGNLNMPDGKRMAYSKDVLGLADPYGYFQAGVLVLNVAELRRLHSSAEWLEIASDPSFIYNDQDILNAHCQGRVTYLDNAWNVMNDCDGRIAKVFSFAPAEVFDAFKAAYASPRVIHYAGFEKPWKAGHCDLREEYFAYARETPFYEALVSQLAASGAPAPSKGRRRVTVEQGHERAVGEDNAVRGVLDPLMPIGSRRREVVKSIVRTVRGQS